MMYIDMHVAQDVGAFVLVENRHDFSQYFVEINHVS